MTPTVLLIVAIMLIVVGGSLLYQPVICHVCDGAMHNIGPGKFYCPSCNREGHA